jgi:glucose-6-phosphate isomerase/transaldolase/glucose-6-phosphate isomerase
VTTFDIAAGPLAIPFAVACAQLEQASFADALWERRLDVWTSDPTTQQKIANRLGWLSALDFITPHLPRLREVAAAVRTAGFTDVVLLGMGGSSLAPEVLRQVLGIADGFPRFRMLDSVDPDAVRAAFDRPATTLFVLASKSGSTIEPNAMAAEAQRRVREAGHASWGPRFVAITDEHTPFHKRAIAEQFRHVFVNPADIGGRFSALSFFGLVPAALMGADVDAIVAAAREMEQACRVRTIADNPGLALGAFLSAGAQHGRDKLTLLLPDRLASLGLWVEQLIAESTGKHGKGVVPIAGERPDAPIGSDRIAVAVRIGAEDPPEEALARARDAGVPLATLYMPDATAIGAEFLRWEVATAAAGLLMKINPFDEPNVQQAKDATRTLLDAYAAQGRLPVPEAHASAGGARLTLSAAAEQALSGAPALSFLQLIQPGDYFGLLAYVPPDDESWRATLGDVRAAIGSARSCATMFGFGPRYLHSTGQLHKGGANNGVFAVITAAAEADLAIPGEPFSFGVLEMAQALGDFQSLDRAGRRAIAIHLPRRDPQLLRTLIAAMTTSTAAT